MLPRVEVAERAEEPVLSTEEVAERAKEPMLPTEEVIERVVERAPDIVLSW